VIIFAPNWLGDAVMALPALGDVRRGLPGSTIAVAAQSRVAPLFELVPDVDTVVRLEGGAPRRADRVFDLAILFPNSFRSALIAFRAGIGERWGYRTDWRSPLLTRAVKRAAAGLHQIDVYQHLVRALGFANGRTEPRIDVSPSRRSAARCLLEQAGWDGEMPLVALAPGAAYGGAKRWPPKSFAAVARALAAGRVRPLLIGSPADVTTGAEIESALGRSSIALNLIGRTDLPTLAGVLANARGLVSNDSGAMHLAAAIGLPVTAVYGPTDERITAPRSPASRPLAVLTHPVRCRPCWLRECPIDHRCMRRVTVDAVVEAAWKML
jgi:heptosyltransferase-2